MIGILLTAFNIYALCPCEYFDRLYAKGIVNIDSIHYDSIVQCYECRDGLGISINPCGNPLLSALRRADIYELDKTNFDVLMDLQKRCYEFQEEIDYSANICEDPYFKRNSYSENTRRSNDLSEISRDACDEYLDDLEDNDNNLKQRSLQWNDYENDIRKPEIYYDEPGSGKGFITGGVSLLIGGIGLCFADAALIRYLYVDQAGKADPYASLIIVMFPTAAAVATIPGGVVLISLGNNINKKMERFKDEKKHLGKLYGLSNEIGLTIKFNVGK
jgi:hypothetical protein